MQDWLSRCLEATEGKEYMDYAAFIQCIEAASKKLNIKLKKKNYDALDKYFSATIESDNQELIVEVADYLIAHPDASVDMVRRAKFEKAKALEKSGKRNPAVAIYSALSEDVSNVEGAESAYRIIETAFKYGSFEKAESLVYEFADKNTPHAFWLAKSFLLLGDVYLSRGDLFQARATYQSVVDGYSNKDDGIINEAIERVESLNN